MLTYQLQSVRTTEFAADEHMYQITKNSLVGPTKYDLTNEQLRFKHVQCVRLNMPDSEFSRTISGLDTRSVSLNGYVNTAGTLTSNGPQGSAEADLMIFCECTT